MTFRQLTDAETDEADSAFRDPLGPGTGQVDAMPEIPAVVTCSPEHYRKLEAQTRREILAKLDAWRDDEERIKQIFANLKARRPTR